MNVMDPPATDETLADSVPKTASCGCSGASQSTSTNCEGDAATKQEESMGGEDAPELLGKIPPEIAMLLVLSGIAGIILPGPIGTPLLLAGGVTIWPKTFQPMERWFSKRFPAAHREGVYQIKQFISHIENRFPTKK